MGILPAKFPGTVRLRFQAPAFGFAGYRVQRNICFCHRALLHFRPVGAVHACRPVQHDILEQPYLGCPACQLPGAEQHPGRTGTPEGSLPQGHKEHDADNICLHVGTGSRGKAADCAADRGEVASRGRFPSDYLFFGHVVPASCHQPEHPPGKRAFRFVPPSGDYQEDHCSRPACLRCIVQHRIHVVGQCADLLYRLFFEQLLFGKPDPLPHPGTDTGHPAYVLSILGDCRRHVEPDIVASFRLAAFAFAVCGRCYLGCLRL